MSVITRAPDEKPADSDVEPASDGEAAAHDLIQAIHAKDVQGVLAAVQALMQAPSQDTDESQEG